MPVKFGKQLAKRQLESTQYGAAGEGIPLG
jgi:hypothetical protein